MDLILWRHAQAEDGPPDAERRLTPRGEKDAALVGGWLRKRIPEGTATVLCSPTRRTRQTADALGVRYETLAAIGPDAAVDAVIDAIGWPDRREGTVVVVGHQPWIGGVVAAIVGGRGESWPVRKAGFWWLGWRTRPPRGEVLVKAAMSPELLR